MFLWDAAEGVPTEQDARIVGLAHEKGKSLVIIVNKWDLIEKHPRMAEAYRMAIRNVFKFAGYAPVLFVSAKTGQRCLSVLDTVSEVFQASKRRLSTSEVNKVFGDAFVSKPPPVYRGVPIKLLYATQVATKPPTFAVFVNHPEPCALTTSVTCEMWSERCSRSRVMTSGSSSDVEAGLITTGGARRRLPGVIGK